MGAILSVGYRVSSRNATRFRQWANTVLKDYILRGYAVNQRFEQLEQRVGRTEEQIAFFVRTALPPVQGVFCNGQIFDAYTFAADLIRAAKNRIILIDNYVDDSVLKMLTEKGLYMLATILKSPKAVETTIAIVEAHAKFREFITLTFRPSQCPFLPAHLRRATVRARVSVFLPSPSALAG